MKDKIEKSLDLSLYISYLKELFNQDIGDSDGGPNNSSKKVNGVNENSSDSSTISLSDDDSEVNVQVRNPAELLKPVSDHLLKELLQYHERWKKSSIPLGSQEDIRNLLYIKTTNKPLSNSSNKIVSSNNRKNKNTSGTITAIPSKKKKPNQNSIEKDGTSLPGKGLQNKGKLNNHQSIRPRKQNLKSLRLEEKTIAKLSTLPTILPMPPSSSASNTTTITITTTTTTSTTTTTTTLINNNNNNKVVLPKTITSISNNNESDSSTLSNSEIKSNIPTPTPLLLPPKNESIEIIKDAEEAERKEKLETSPLISKKNSNGKNSDNKIENQNDSNDDDNSLSDFVTMTNTISAPSISSLLLNKNKPASFPSVPYVSPGEGKKISAKEIKKKQPVQSTGKDTSPQKQAKMIEIMNLKRRRIFILIAKKEIGKTQRTRANTVKEMIVARRKIAQACSRHLRQKAIQSQKTMKETNWRAKRLTREMQAYWKQSDRLEREVRRRKEKEAEEQRKLDLEMIEIKRQQRKLNFLITQTELYAHFISKKLGQLSSNSTEEKAENIILCQLNDDETNSRKLKADDFNCDSMKEKAKANVANALKIQAQQMKEYVDIKGESKKESDGQFKQPKMFEGILKHYQLKGMNWLINLYDQGINGILADDMGLGKTIQSIAFLAHVAERYKLWGPILIIAPASTLHNWQQEFRRFLPPFKIVPYWGNPQERKILRQFWQQSNLHTQEASFHVVVTSYQIVVADLKYFNRIKWLYLILDEAQSIKNAASARWKMLLGFNCRNRLLLTGTPIQNTMGELWALLHFIMPTLFDSHEEFNEWFSRDIESHAENKSPIDEKHLSRLHLILKPFMLRRIKKDVENELSDKIEILHYCPLTTRQKKLYSTLKKKIKIEDLLKSAGPSNSQLAQNTTTNLMNLVMQFRKVCNHPDIFERPEVKSPFNLPKLTNSFPKLLFRDGILHLSLPSKIHLLENMFSVFTPENLVIKRNAQKQNTHFSSFLYFIGLTPGDVFQSIYGGVLGKLKIFLKLQKILEKVYEKSLLKQLQYESVKNNSLHIDRTGLLINLNDPLSYVRLKNLDYDDTLIFTSYTEPFYTFSQHTYHRMPESIDHREVRSKMLQSLYKNSNLEQKISLIEEIPHLQRPTEIRKMHKTYLPSFLYQQICPKAISPLREIHFHDRSAAWWIKSLYQMLPGEETNLINYGIIENKKELLHFSHKTDGGLYALSKSGRSQFVIPDKEKLVTDSGKLGVLNNLLKFLKANGHRVLIYSQMTRMIDLLEEYMLHRKYSYIRLDGSSKISERRDMVADFQTRSDIFVFLLSTRAGGLGINLTAADTVIFYDSDWNPTVDQQAMDRAHRLGQTKQVTVYRLICKGTIEERILQRAKEKNEIQKMVISGGAYRTDTLKPKEVVSLLLDDEDLERKYRQKQAEKNLSDDSSNSKPLEDNKTISLKKMSTISSNKNFVENGNFKKVKIDASELSTLQSVQPSNVDRLEERDEKLFNNVEGTRDVLEWNAFEDDDNFTLISKRPRLGRGTGKRGRPPSRVRSYTREFNLNSESGKRGRGPGRPRLKPIGPLNQGMRGRRPGRPPKSGLILPSKSMNSSINSITDSPSESPCHSANSSVILTPSTTSQKVFGFYSSPDLDIS